MKTLFKWVFLSFFGIVLLATCAPEGCSCEEQKCPEGTHKHCEFSHWLFIPLDGTTMMIPVDDCKCREGSGK